MPRLPDEVKTHLNKARESALLAVETYNRPGASFRSGGYVVLMCIAWTALLHAIFFKRGVKPFYRKKSHRGHFEMVDGDRRAWELVTCAQEFWRDSDSPVRRNISFFIGLRNKIEHRSMPQLDMTIFGECQSFLFNFEDLLVAEFGERFALNESLSFSLQFSRIRNEERQKSARKLHERIAKSVASYVNDFRSSLSTDVLADSRFSYKVFLIPKPANREKGADAAVEFVKFDPSNPTEMARYERIVSLVKPSVAPLGAFTAQTDAGVGVAASANIRLVNDPEAAVFGAVDYDRTHPHIQKRLIAAVNTLLPAGVRINQFDVLAVRRTHDVDSKPNFYHKGAFGPSQYSNAFAEWLVSSFRQDKEFFVKARARYKSSR
jgi:hypothetical protein